MSETRLYGKRGEAEVSEQADADGALPPEDDPSGPETPRPVQEPPGRTGAPVHAPVNGAEGPRGVPAARRLKHYVIGRRIGAGGMGEIYQAYDTTLHRPVAIKTMKKELARDEAVRARFLREAQLQAKVVHPHVAQIYFVGEDAGTPFIAMQLLDGGSLEAAGRLDWREAARHMLGVAEGLARASRLGIIHSDIKPANILLDEAGEAHLADFGLASRAVVPPGASPERRAPERGARVVMGTLEYMAPEQLRGGPVDARADMYALGATFYQLLTGKPPLTASSLEEAAAAHARARPRRLRRLAPAVPRAVAAVIDRCLEQKPERRYATFDELVSALRRAVPPPPAPAGALPRAVAWVIDLVPALWLLRYEYLEHPRAALLAFLVTAAVPVRALGATPGMWLMRLRLRTSGDGDVSTSRAVFRALMQGGWLLPTGEFLRLTYSGSRMAEGVGVAAVAWAALSLLGALGALFSGRLALHDRLSGTRVSATRPS